MSDLKPLCSFCGSPELIVTTTVVVQQEVVEWSHDGFGTWWAHSYCAPEPVWSTQEDPKLECTDCGKVTGYCMTVHPRTRGDLFIMQDVPDEHGEEGANGSGQEHDSGGGGGVAGAGEAG